MNRFVGQAIDKMSGAGETTSLGVSRVRVRDLVPGIRDDPTIVGWGLLYAISAAIGADRRRHHLVDGRRSHPCRIPFAAGSGRRLGFSINVSSAMLNGDADKWLLVRMNEAAANGIYAAGYQRHRSRRHSNVALGECDLCALLRASGRGKQLHWPRSWPFVVLC